MVRALPHGLMENLNQYKQLTINKIILFLFIIVIVMIIINSIIAIIMIIIIIIIYLRVFAMANL